MTSRKSIQGSARAAFYTDRRDCTNGRPHNRRRRRPFCRTVEHAHAPVHATSADMILVAMLTTQAAVEARGTWPAGANADAGVGACHLNGRWLRRLGLVQDVSRRGLHPLGEDAHGQRRARGLPRGPRPEGLLGRYPTVPGCHMEKEVGPRGEARLGPAGLACAVVAVTGAGQRSPRIASPSTARRPRVPCKALSVRARDTRAA